MVEAWIHSLSAHSKRDIWCMPGGWVLAMMV